VPNARLIYDLALLDQLERASRQDGNIEGVKRQLANQVLSGTDPQVWWSIGERLGYLVDVGWSDDNSSGAYDVVFTNSATQAVVPVGVPAQVSAGEHINHPLRGKLARSLGPKLRSLCQEKLPEYMLPAHFMMLTSLPLTPHGKIDKRAMLLPENLTTVKRDKLIVPENELENLIASVWSDILGIEQPGLTDNFFDLGGHSMLMVQVCNRLRDQLSRDVPVLMMFQYPTIRTLADALKDLPGTNTPNLRITEAAAERARRQRQNIQARAAHKTSQRK
jgi:acyl carrier protein